MYNASNDDLFWGITNPHGIDIPLKYIDIEGHIKDHAASYTISQTFINTKDECCEAIYTFPVGWSCVVTKFVAIINGERLCAKTLSKNKAEQKYTDSIDDGDLPIMLETSQDGIATVSLGNLKKNDEVTLEISFFTMLLPENGAIRLTLPLNIGDRYSANGKQGKLQPYEQLTTDFYAEYEATAKFYIEGVLANTSISVHSHNYELDVLDNRIVVTVDDAYADKNLVLAFDDVGALNKGYIVKDPFKKHNYLTLLASTLKSNHSYAQQPLALHILVDLSGSMEGVGILKLREALASLTEILGENDAITLTGFGSMIDDKIPKLKRFDKDFVSSTFIPVIDKLDANLGGTELQTALTFVLNKAKVSRDEEKGQVIVQHAHSAHRRVNTGKYKHALLLIADGEVCIDEAAFMAQTLGSAKNKDIPVFCIGVGDCAVASFLKKIATAFNASCEMVTHAEDMGAPVARLIKCARTEVVTVAHLSFDPTLVSIEPSLVKTNHVEKPKPKIYWIKQPKFCYTNIATATFMASHCMPNKQNLELMAKTQDGNEYNLAKVIFETIADEDLAREFAQYIAYQRFAENNDVNLAIRYGLLTPLTSMILVKERAENDKGYGVETINVPQMADPGLQTDVMYDCACDDASVANCELADLSESLIDPIPPHSLSSMPLSSAKNADDYAEIEDKSSSTLKLKKSADIKYCQMFTGSDKNSKRSQDTLDVSKHSQDPAWPQSVKVVRTTIDNCDLEVEDLQNSAIDSFITHLRQSPDLEIFKSIVLAVFKDLSRSPAELKAMTDFSHIWNLVLTKLQDNATFNIWHFYKSLADLFDVKDQHQSPAEVLVSMVLLIFNADLKELTKDSTMLSLPEALIGHARFVLADSL